VIIVLGEAVIGVVLGTATVNWTAASSVAAFAGFLAAAAIWWLYFDFSTPRWPPATCSAG
jgi:low temperature requirement protein LtrA